MPALLGTRRVPYLAGAWTPARLPGLVLWLDAGSIGQADNTSVAVWRDRSGQGNDAAQGTVAAQPTYLAAGVNGRPGLGGDAVDDVMFVAPPAATYSALTLFVVGAAKTTSRSLFDGRNVVGATINLAIANFYTESGVYKWRVRNNTGTLVDVLTSSLPMTPQVWSCRWDGATTALWQGGALVNSSALAGTVTLNKLILFAQQTGTAGVYGDYDDGATATCLLYGRALTTAERHQVEGYLSARYAIPVVQS